MTILIQANNKKLKTQLLKFHKKQYLEDPLKRDSMSGLLSGILFEKSQMSKAVKAFPILVKEGEDILLTAVLANVDRMDDYLQIAFFESPEYKKEAFDLLMDHALKLARELGCSKISASLNLHVNYGLGFLADSYKEPQSFGMAHNPPHFHRYFMENGFQKIDLLTFKKDMENMESLVPESLSKKLQKKYLVRNIDFKKLRQEALTYTRINNDAFRDHLFYYKRVPKEDLELFKDFRHILRPENLLFVQKDGEDIGFMLWYPDFHQIMPPSSSIGIGTVLRSRFQGRKIDTFKIVEMGIVQSHQGKGAILALFDHLQRITSGRYRYFESGWVLKDNHQSRAFGDKWSDGISKSYAAYVKEL